MQITRICDEDMLHLRAFPDERKAEIVQEIMSRKPVHSVALNRDDGFENTVARLRNDGYVLIDFQPQESAFTTLWYRNGNALRGLAGTEVVMLLWETGEGGDATTVMMWRV